jgi:hypothetical protein
MAKLLHPAGVGGMRTQALGPAYRIADWRGIPRIFSLKHKGTKKLSSRQRETMRDFGQLARIHLWVTGREYQMARRLSAGTQFLPRDLLMMAYSGNLWRFQGPDGQWWYSMAARTTTSDFIDVITSLPGAMLYRGPGWWEVILPGNDGEVLTSHGADAAPTWEVPSGGGGGVSAITLRRTSNYSVPAGNNAVPWNAAILSDWAGWDVSAPTRIELPAAATRFRMFCQIYDNSYSVGGTNSNLFQLYDADTAGAIDPDIAFQPTIAATADRMWQMSSGWIPRGSVDALQFMRWPSYGGTILMNERSYLTIEVDQI